MKIIPILLAFLNSVIGCLPILSCVSAGEALGWITFKTGAGILAICFGILTFKDGFQPLHRSRFLLNNLFLVIMSVSAITWGIHWSITSGDIKNTILVFGGGLFIQDMTSFLDLAGNRE